MKIQIQVNENLGRGLAKVNRKTWAEIRKLHPTLPDVDVIAVGELFGPKYVLQINDGPHEVGDGILELSQDVKKSFYPEKNSIDLSSLT